MHHCMDTNSCADQISKVLFLQCQSDWDKHQACNVSIQQSLALYVARFLRYMHKGQSIVAIASSQIKRRKQWLSYIAGGRELCCQEMGDYFWGSGTAVLLRVHHMRFKFPYSICSTKLPGLPSMREIMYCLKSLHQHLFFTPKAAPQYLKPSSPLCMAMHRRGAAAMCCLAHATLHVCEPTPISMLS